MHSNDDNFPQPRVILLVEDDCLVSEILTIILRESYFVVTASTIAAAILGMDEQAFDAVLLDRQLPDGYSDAVAIRARAEGCPVVWMSGAPLEPNVTGNDPVLYKPFNTDDLLASLASAMRQPAFPAMV